ncbi:MAG TPA: hypothetical protein VM582_01125 [Candidatus Thermoplasmatota archaeon]|nr:hypothetical protein [Candidatus Thermoplasmatota archaeon]
MRTIPTLLVSGVLLLGGLATASPTKGEQTLTLDLSSIPGGSTYFIKCSRSHSLTDCGLVSLWQQSNEVGGLQTTTFAYGGRIRQPDTALLP